MYNKEAPIFRYNILIIDRDKIHTCLVIRYKMDAEDVDDDTGSSETSEEPASLFSDASIEDVNDYDNDQPSKHEEVNK
jgi:hypothetical protein